MSPTISRSVPSTGSGAGPHTPPRKSRANKWNVPRKNANALSAMRAILKRIKCASRWANGRLNTMNSWMGSRMGWLEGKFVDQLSKSGVTPAQIGAVGTFIIGELEPRPHRGGQEREAA